MKITIARVLPLLFVMLGNFELAPPILAANIPSTIHGLPPEMERQAQQFPATYHLRGPEQVKRIAFTFDDGPSSYTSELLAILKKHNVKATFFCKGRYVEALPDIVRAVASDGHTIANHSYSHPHSQALSVDMFWKDEVGRTQEIFRKILGFAPTLYRPPFGEIKDAQIVELQKNGLHAIGWSIDPEDWNLTDKTDIAANIEEYIRHNLHPGAIVLMHDGDNGTRINTLKAVDKLIPLLKAQGYEFVTVDKLLKVPGKLDDLN